MVFKIFVTIVTLCGLVSCGGGGGGESPKTENNVSQKYCNSSQVFDQENQSCVNQPPEFVKKIQNSEFLILGDKLDLPSILGDKDSISYFNLTPAICGVENNVMTSFLIGDCQIEIQVNSNDSKKIFNIKLPVVLNSKISDLIFNDSGNLVVTWQSASKNNILANQIEYQLHASYVREDFEPNQSTLVYKGGMLGTEVVNLQSGKYLYLKLVVQQTASQKNSRIFSTKILIPEIKNPTPLDLKINVNNTEPTIGDVIGVSFQAIWKDVDLLLVKIGNKIFEIFKDFSNVINYVVDDFGDLEIIAQLKDLLGNVLGSTSVKVNIKKITVQEVIPSNQIISTSNVLKITGDGFKKGMTVDFTGGKCNEPTDITVNDFNVFCSFDKVGQQVISVYNSAKILVGTKTINIQSNVKSVKWRNNNSAVYYGEVVFFYINGINLSNDLNLFVDRCIPIDLGVSGDNNQRSFKCDFKTDNILESLQLIGVIKNNSGDVLYSFLVPLEADQKPKNSLLTATGITLCGNDKSNDLPCTFESIGDFLGLNQDGELKAGKEMSYSLINFNNDQCVKDNVTGLVWEQKTDDNSLRDKDWTYTWYSSVASLNAGNPGTRNGGSCFGKNNGYDCDTQSYVQTLNNLNYCGYNDWRVPTRTELISILDYGRKNPSINPIFSNSANGNYWTISPKSTSVNDYKGLFWNVDFVSGFVDYDGFNASSIYLRAVRSGN